MKHTRFIAPQKYIVDVEVEVMHKGVLVGHKLKEGVRLVETTAVGLELDSVEIYQQDSYKSTLGTDARKSRLRGKADAMYNNVKIDTKVEAVKVAKKLKARTNITQQDVRMQLQANGMTKGELRKLRKMQKAGI